MSTGSDGSVLSPKTRAVAGGGPRVLLETRGLTKVFGGLTAVSNLDLQVPEGQIVGLIGPNGAGKSTVFNLITGVIRPTAGRVIFDGGDITGKKAHVTARLGIGRTFQSAYLFPEFTVLDNLVAASFLHPRCNFWEALFNTPGYRRKEAAKLEQAKEILRFVGLDEVQGELAKNLPHGYQKVLGVARALATKPKLLLLDEPIAGMTAEEIAFSLDVFRKIGEQGVTILLIEHNLEFMALCDKVFVLNFGQKIAEGTAQEVREDDGVCEAYFGIDDVA
ncbi:MAG: ABC transporter ATP-binding protein [Thermoleophilia bacterium]